MFKLVVLSLLAAAVAEPSGLLYGSPGLTYSSLSTVLSPATTTISKSASSVVHPSPIYTSYAAPLTYSHFIKKRSPQFFQILNPAAWLGATLAAPLLRNPAVVQSPILPETVVLPSHTTHFIKKRSAPLLAASSFIAPTTYSAPLLTSYAGISPVWSSPYYSSPIAYSTPITHFIKKRSVPLLSTYLAPTSYSHQSRIDLINHPSPLLKVASYHAPLNFPYLY